LSKSNLKLQHYIASLQRVIYYLVNKSMH